MGTHTYRYLYAQVVEVSSSFLSQSFAQKHEEGCIGKILNFTFIASNHIYARVIGCTNDCD
jgi:hypothetical protein